MTETNDLIVKLSSSEIYCTEEPKDAFFVKQGSVLVYIVPIENGQPGKRVLLCEVQERKMIPAFYYRDREYKTWAFLLVAKEETELEVRKGVATEILRKNFLKGAGISSYEREGYENSLVDRCRHELLKEDTFIIKGQQDEPAAKEDALGAVRIAVSSSDPQLGTSDNMAYRALTYVTKKIKADLLAEEDVIARCGKNASVQKIALASNLICREVVLDADWYKNDCGALIATLDKKTVACYPGGKNKYRIYYPEENREEYLTAALARQISPKAFFIGRTLPRKKLTGKDVLSFCTKSLVGRDMFWLVFWMALCTIIGVVMPKLNQLIYDEYVPMGDLGSLTEMCVVILSVMLGNLTFSVVKNLFGFRITTRIGTDLQNASYHRLFHLPESFFRSYDSADLGQRMLTIGATANSIANTVLITGLSALLAIVYFIQMLGYSGKLAWWGLGMYLIYIVILVVITLFAKKREANIAEAEGEASGKLYQYLNGVDKIRMAGVEDRALLSYMQPFARKQSEEIKVNRLVSASESLTAVVSSIFSMVLYLIIVNGKLQLSVGAFVAFNSAFGAFTGALSGLVREAINLYQNKHTINRFWPVFETMPEDDDSKEMPGELSGGVELEHVSFSYTAGGKNVLNDLSLRIKPGEYVGIVGSSGCGKSTLLKLLLGFESPQAGCVMVDGKDLSELNKSAYRRQLGVVLQNGKLISGSIYENITITAPNVKMSRVNEVIDQVGLREDINQMPMGIHTVLSETSNTISGGQQQRILIARAIVGSPKLLIFDEATSALDNITQAAVSSNLDKMHVTRIVVAHRLSTIKNCDRILVLKDGNIAEEGNYESLMAQKGLFYALASRQIAQ